MANPFPTKFDSECQSCGDLVFEGDSMYVVDGSFVCEGCAEENGNVCACGSFKKEEYEKCYECFQEDIGKTHDNNNHDIIEEEETPEID